MWVYSSAALKSCKRFREKTTKRIFQVVGFIILYACAVLCTATGIPALPQNLITQEEIASGAVTLEQIRAVGKLIYTTPYNKSDGLGDGPCDISKDRTQPGNRPTIQNPFTPFLRVNGLDAQTCLECHSVLSRAEVPMTFAVGGHGGHNNSPFFMPSEIDVDSDASQVDGVAQTNGRVINPLFNFGGGGVELVAKEMTLDLQEIKARAENAVLGTEFALVTKGVSFGKVISNGDGTLVLEIDSNGHAIDEDLVVRPFGRKGEFATIRDFDIGAVQFHFGMQPSEVVGQGVDDDGDEVIDEITVGEMSALSIFLASMPPPRIAEFTPEGRAGEQLFSQIGCSTCHIPEMLTERASLNENFPEFHSKPFDNTFYSMDMSQPPIEFEKNQEGGIRVMMFSDLKRHDMGPGLAETTNGRLDSHFITARLWGVADSAPYLHDGRALTLSEAIMAHGGEARSAKKKYHALSDSQQTQLLAYLRLLRVPDRKAIDRLIRGPASQ